MGAAGAAGAEESAAKWPASPVKKAVREAVGDSSTAQGGRQAEGGGARMRPPQAIVLAAELGLKQLKEEKRAFKVRQPAGTAVAGGGRDVRG